MRVRQRGISAFIYLTPRAHMRICFSTPTKTYYEPIKHPIIKITNKQACFKVEIWEKVALILIPTSKNSECDVEHSIYIHLN